MFKKTAGVLILFAALFTLSISRVEAHVWSVSSINNCSNLNNCNVLSSGTYYIGVTDTGYVDNDLTIIVSSTFNGSDHLSVDFISGNSTSLVSVGITSPGTYTYRYNSHSTPDYLRIMANCANSVNCSITGAYIDEVIAAPTSAPPNGSPEIAPTVGPTGGGGGAVAPASGCSDAVPGGAPVLLSAAAKGNNSVILTWTLAPDPVTYYLLTYGTTSGAQTYGNPNVGGRDTKNYTVNNLSGGTRYYFRIRAGNGCAPGPYSNELSTGAGGIILTGPAAGFIPGVLGAKTQSSVVTPTPTPTPSPNPGQLEWILTHKNISGRIALILLANVYVYYLSNKKRNNF